MRFILLILTVVLLITTAAAQKPVIVKTDKINGIICTNFSDWKSLVTAKKFWTPTKEEVLKAEEKIEAHLKANPKAYADLWTKIPKYKRQYLGIVVNGHKRIFCNFFCLLEGPLTDKPFIVFDGGACFFRIEYDLNDKKCYDFQANGTA